jgi:hypothetical protein
MKIEKRVKVYNKNKMKIRGIIDIHLKNNHHLNHLKKSIQNNNSSLKK